MGSSNSKDFTSNEYLLKFAGKEHITSVDPFWNVFLAFSFNPPMSRAENELIDHRFTEIFDKLLVNNLSSGNFGSLLHVFLCRSAELLAATDNNNNIFLWQTYNALFILRCFTKYLVENVKEIDIIKEFDARPLQLAAGLSNFKPDALVNREFQDRRLEMFLDALIEIVVDVPLEEHTYHLHLEAIHCILVLLSTQMFTQKPATKSFVYMNIMQGKDAIHAPLLVKTLLGHFVHQDKGTNKHSGSLVLDLASGLWHMLTLGYGSNSSSDTIQKGQSLLGNQSLLLLLVLGNHCTAEKNVRNPYREALFAFTNTHGPNPAVPTSAASTFKFDLSQLYVTLCNTAMNECSTLMLYLLLHRNQTVKTFILARADIEALIVPILRTLYNASDSSCHHVYMSLIILLIFSEDSLFSKTVHQITLKNVSWYNERAISEVSLGDLLVLVVIRTIHYNMLKVRDKYLHTNCLAALANMSSNFRHLHSYVSQRLLSLFETLAKKYSRLQLELNKRQQTSQNKNDSTISVPDNVEQESSNNVQNSISINMGDPTTSEPNQTNDVEPESTNGHENESTYGNESCNSTDLDQSDLVQDLVVLEEVLRMVLEIINSCLTNQLQHNPNLIYALLYKRHIFEPFRNHSSFEDLLQNLETIINYFSYKLQQCNSDLSVSDVLSTIMQGALQWPAHKLKKFPELKFKYVEEEQPEKFFIPYVWSLVCQHSDLNWSTTNINLFAPDGEL